MGFPEIYEQPDTEHVGYSEHPQNGGYIDIVWEGYGGHIIKNADNLFVAYYKGEEIGGADSLELARMLVVVEAGG